MSRTIPPYSVSLIMEINSTDIYGTRLLIFLETEPQSNKYNQVILDPEEFKKTAFSLGKVLSKEDNGNDRVHFNISDEEYDLPDLLEIDYGN